MNHKGPNEQYHKPASLGDCLCHLGIVVHSNKVIEGNVYDDSGEAVPRQLNDDISNNEGGPGVHFGGTLSCFVQIALHDVVGHCLIGEERKYDQQHENREHLMLKAQKGYFRLQKGQSDKQCLKWRSARFRQGRLHMC